MLFAKVLGAAALLITAQASSAATRQYDFTARIDQLDVLYPSGTTFTGSFFLDDTLVPSNVFVTPSGQAAIYRDSSLRLTMVINAQSFIASGFAGVFDEQVVSEEADGFSIGGTDLINNVFINLSVYGGKGNTSLFTGIGLPSSFPTSLWQGPFTDPNDDDDLTVPSGEVLYFDPTSGSRFSALVLDIRAVGAPPAVPEPTSWLLLISGLGVTGATLRRAKRKARITAEDLVAA